MIFLRFSHSNMLAISLALICFLSNFFFERSYQTYLKSDSNQIQNTVNNIKMEGVVNMYI
uniref:Uncharacterized protein n=1 Tax=Oryza brachyantha TaxID=4533 RepID=J3MHJ5_ORYBR